MTTGLKKLDVFLGNIASKLKKRNVTTEIKLNTNSNIFTTITIDEFAKDPNSGKLEVQYWHDHACLSAATGLTHVPLVEVNGVLGNGHFAIGGEAAFDTNSRTFTKYNAGIDVNESDFTASLLLMDKEKRTTVVAELVHKLSKDENTFTIGSSYAWDPMNTVKTRVDKHGTVETIVKHEWMPKSTVTVSATKTMDRPAKYGIALAFNP
ncbi:hypothetical protein KP509_1Z044400 [Ceratopteris richardii]|nr:hypothetical protein KP509_1Z044400 [Ceratopteris richardii]